MTPRLSGHISIFSLGIAKQWSREKFANLSLKPPFQRGMVREEGASPPSLPPPPPSARAFYLYLWSGAHNF